MHPFDIAKGGIVKSRSLVLAALLAIVTLIALQSRGAASSNVESAYPEEGRYAIVESEIALRDTWRLDRWRGKVWLMVQNSETKRLRWQPMQIIDAPDVPLLSSTPRFHLVTSGIAANSTYMLDTVSGKTWVCVTDSTTKEDFWAPVKDD